MVYQSITRNIRVCASPIYLERESSPEQSSYVWAYTITVENLGNETVQLLSRYWHITDDHGQVHEVEGEGVVGERPILTPGASFEYTSAVPIKTPSGIMRGHYVMITDAQESFQVEVPAFSLDSPDSQAPIN